MELHRCVVSNNTAGFETQGGADDLLDDPQGEGGAIVVEKQVTMLLADCVCEHNWAAKKVCCPRFFEFEVVSPRECSGVGVADLGQRSTFHP